MSMQTSFHSFREYICTAIIAFVYYFTCETRRKSNEADVGNMHFHLYLQMCSRLTINQSPNNNFTWSLYILRYPKLKNIKAWIERCFDVLGDHFSCWLVNKMRISNACYLWFLLFVIPIKCCKVYLYLNFRTLIQNDSNLINCI